MNILYFDIMGIVSFVYIFGFKFHYELYQDLQRCIIEILLKTDMTMFETC